MTEYTRKYVEEALAYLAGRSGEPLFKELQKVFEAMQADLDAALDAIKFYSDPGDYKAPYTGGLGKLYYDCGEKAKQTLARLARWR